MRAPASGENPTGKRASFSTEAKRTMRRMTCGAGGATLRACGVGVAVQHANGWLRARPLARLQAWPRLTSASESAQSGGLPHSAW